MVRHRANHPIPNRQLARRMRRQLREQVRQLHTQFPLEPPPEVLRAYRELATAMPSLRLRSGAPRTELETWQLEYLHSKLAELRTHRAGVPDVGMHFASAGPLVVQLDGMMRDERLSDRGIIARLLEVPRRLVYLRLSRTRPAHGAASSSGSSSSAALVSDVSHFS